MAKKTTQQPLTGKEICHEVTDVPNINLIGLNTRIIDGIGQRSREHVKHFKALAGPISSKVGLAATKNINVTAHSPPPVVIRMRPEPLYPQTQ